MSAGGAGDSSGALVPVSIPSIPAEVVSEIIRRRKAPPPKVSIQPKKLVDAPAVPKPSESWATLNDKGQKARYGVAYVRAICSQAGVPMTEGSPDEDVFAVDCLVTMPELEVRVQVKCTSTLKLTGGSSSVQLKQDWCEKWAKSKTPVYLVLVIVPKDIGTWIDHTDLGTFHATAAFWVRVDGISANSVSVPRVNRLTTATLGQWHGDLLADYGSAS